MTFTYTFFIFGIVKYRSSFRGIAYCWPVARDCTNQQMIGGKIRLGVHSFIDQINRSIHCSLAEHCCRFPTGMKQSWSVLMVSDWRFDSWYRTMNIPCYLYSPTSHDELQFPVNFTFYSHFTQGWLISLFWKASIRKHFIQKPICFAVEIRGLFLERWIINDNYTSWPSRILLHPYLSKFHMQTKLHLICVSINKADSAHTSRKG